MTDKQVRRLFALRKVEESGNRGGQSGHGRKDGAQVSPAGASAERIDGGTRADTSGCFQEVWEEVQSLLEVNPGLEAKTIFEFLQRRYPGRFADGQLRTLQRRVKVWRATEGPAQEVFFAQRASSRAAGCSRLHAHG